MNENPWDRLEKEQGLQPRGTWITRSDGRGSGAAGSSQQQQHTADSAPSRGVGQVDAGGAHDAVVLSPEEDEDEKKKEEES